MDRQVILARQQNFNQTPINHPANNQLTICQPEHEHRTWGEAAFYAAKNTTNGLPFISSMPDFVTEA